MTHPKPRKILVVTGTRADWGLLSPVVAALEQDPRADVAVLATNMHLMEAYGNTLDEVKGDVHCPVHSLPCNAPEDQLLDSRLRGAVAMGRIMAGGAELLGQIRPEIVVILGDRYEMLAVASLAIMMRVPVAHIHGGEVTEGAMDDNIRHAITKLSALHFTSNEQHRLRVIQMGEEPTRVFNVGAPGVYNALHVTPMDDLQFARHLISLGAVPLRPDTVLVTYHPATLDPVSPKVRIQALLEALDRFPQMPLLFTYPNNDPGSDDIIAAIEDYVARHRERANVVRSLGRRGYMTALRHVKAVIGNSSSGIIEVPSMHIPTIDIGMRQRGRLSSPTVIHCGDSADDIAAAVTRALSPDFLAMCQASNPYEKDNTPQAIADTLLDTPLSLLSIKHFYDLQP